MLPYEVRIDAQNFCEARGYDYAKIINADQKNIWDMGKVNALIMNLAENKHEIKYISTCANVPSDYVARVIRKRQQKPD